MKSSELFLLSASSPSCSCGHLFGGLFGHLWAFVHAQNEFSASHIHLYTSYKCVRSECECLFCFHIISAHFRHVPSFLCGVWLRRNHLTWANGYLTTSYDSSNMLKYLSKCHRGNGAVISYNLLALTDDDDNEGRACILHVSFAAVSYRR